MDDRYTVETATTAAAGSGFLPSSVQKKNISIYLLKIKK
jgi:hypothetical protein